MERKTVKFEVKEVDEEAGVFTGYAATFSDTPDSWGDIIDKGAFKKSLKVAGNRVKILWNHYVLEPIGKPLELTEDEKGLFVKGKLSLGVQRAREVLSLMKDGVITEMSIGYDTMKETWQEGIRHLQEIRLWDVSPVTFAANPEAVVLSVKKATSFGNLPLTDRDKEWDAAPTEKRVRAWAGGEDNMNWNKYRQAFFWYDEGDSELFGSYKLGFADVINNRLTAIPRGIFAVAAVLMGARGGVAIPEAEEAGVKSHVEKYYAKMRKEFDDEDIVAPWNKSIKAEELKPYPNEHACRLRDPDDFEKDSFRRMTRKHEGKEYSVIMGRLKGEDTMTEQAYRYDREVWEEDEAKNHCKDHDGTFEPAKEKTFKCECIDCGHKVESKKHCSDIKCPECGGEMRRAERPGPGKALTFADQAETVLAAVTEWIDRTKSLADLRLKEGRVLSTANRKRLASLLEALETMASDIKELLEATQPEEGEKLEAFKAIVSGLKAENEGFDIKKTEGRIEAILEQLRK